MKTTDIVRGATYTAQVSGRIVHVRVDTINSLTIRDVTRTVYHVTNLTTMRQLTFKSARRFRQRVRKTTENLENIA